MTGGALARRAEEVLLSAYKRFPLVLVDAEGCRVRDAGGRSYLDLLAGIAVNALGHRHPALVAALHEAADGPWHFSNLYHSLPHVELAEELCRAAGMEKVFYCNSGTEAVECALKIARRAGGPERRTLVAAGGSFHGRTLGALSVTGQPGYREPFAPLIPRVRHVPFGDEGALDEAVDGSVAAVLLEPVQGEGGVRLAPDGYLEAARRCCDRAGALLLLDEIQCGLGRTGRLFAWEWSGVRPDVLCLAKPLAGGLPIGAVLARGAAARALQPGDHGCTFGGGPLVTRVALAFLRELLRPGFLEEARRVGELFGEGLRAEAGAAGGVKEVRGRGMMWGVELHRECAAAVVDALLERRVLAACAGPSVVRFLPPLVLSEEEAREGIEAAGAALREVVP